MTRHHLSISTFGLCLVLCGCGSEWETPTAAIPPNNRAAVELVREDRVGLIFEAQTPEVTLSDPALALALLNLGAAAPDDETAIAAANLLLGTPLVGDSITALTPEGADYAATAGAFDLKDVAVLLASTRSPTNPLTNEAIANATTALLGSEVLRPEDIRAIPGVSVPPLPSPFQNATSQTCGNVRGLTALYWDYSNGLIRPDYPETILTIPFAPGIPFTHSVQPLYSFFYPFGWQVQELTVPQRSLTGANVNRQDGRAVWRRLNYTAPGAIAARSVLDSELRELLSFFGNPQPVEVICTLDAPDATAAGTLIRAGEFTANLTAQAAVTPSPFGGAVTAAFVQVTIAPTADYNDTALNVFFSLTGQLSPSPQCSDRIDNDNDGAIDFPADSGCTSIVDTSER